MPPVGTSSGRGRIPFVALVTILLAVGLLPADAAGQELTRVEQLAAEGRTADARDSLLAWWETEWEDASRSEREHGLWLRGVLTLDPAAASGMYRRIVVEYPAGAHARGALARLGQLSAAMGDTLAAARWLSVLERDYPGSAEGVTTATWLSGELPEQDDDAPSPVSPAPSPVPPESDEVRATGNWTVQLGAFSSEASARQVADEVRAAGFDVRVVLVEGSDLWRIRSGRFVEDDEARPLAARMVEAGFQAAVIPGANDEIGGG